MFTTLAVACLVVATTMLALFIMLKNHLGENPASALLWAIKTALKR